MGEGLAGVKLIIVIAAAVLILIAVFGKPLTGFSVLSLLDVQAQSNKAMLDDVLKENPELGSSLTQAEKTKLYDVISDKKLTKEQIEDLVRSMHRSPEELAETQKIIEEALRTGPTAVGGYEESFVIGGKTYTEDELKNMTAEQIEALTGQTQGGGTDK
ncbi:MAG: hypothetical protein HYW05_01135 [Candidatus Diapherotrites archaeon]|nr:hypothetical protein [Candidatus Diapherotrites archaeon]